MFRAEVEAAADAGVDDQECIASLVLHHLNASLDDAAALVLFFIADEDQRGYGEVVNFFGIAVNLHGFGGVGVLQVRVVDT